MKNILKTIPALLILAAVMTACEDRKYERVTYEANVPVYMDYDEFRASFL